MSALASHKTQAGIYYAEVLLAVILLVILLVPAMQSLNASLMVNAGDFAARNLQLSSKMEEVLSKPFNELYAEASTSSTTTISTYSDSATTANRRIVVLYRYDINTNTLSSNDTGLIYVSTYFEADGPSNALNTLLGRWW